MNLSPVHTEIIQRPKNKPGGLTTGRPLNAPGKIQRQSSLLEEVVIGIRIMEYITMPLFPIRNLTWCALKPYSQKGFHTDLITYTKNGKRIDHLLAAYYPGVVKIGELGIKNNDLQSSTIKTDTIQKIEAVCDWLGDKRGYICDTIFTNYKLSADGKFVLVNSDTILNSQLNATRKMRLD